MPDWKLVLGIALIISGIYILYVEVSTELSRNARRFDYVPTQETIMTGVVIGTALLVAGAALLISGRKHPPFHAREPPGA